MNGSSRLSTHAADCMVRSEHMTCSRSYAPRRARDIAPLGCSLDPFERAICTDYAPNSSSMFSL